MVTLIMFTEGKHIVFALFLLLLQTHKVNDLNQTAVTMVTGAVADTLWCWVTLCCKLQDRVGEAYIHCMNVFE